MQILELQLLSSDLSETHKFYHETLGMDIQYADDSLLRLSAGLSTLVFKKSGNKNPFYHFAFNIPPNKFEEAFDWAESRLPLIRVTPSSFIADFRNWNAKAFYFFDNNRNIVEFIARFDLENNSSRPFDGSSVISVSEIGLVVDKAADYSDQLISEHELNFFSRQPPQEDFAAIGDDHGLFIVVNDHRNWYPTSQPSGKFWTLVKFKEGKKILSIEMPGE